MQEQTARAMSDLFRPIEKDGVGAPRPEFVHISTQPSIIGRVGGRGAMHDEVDRVVEKRANDEGSVALLQLCLPFALPPTAMSLIR